MQEEVESRTVTLCISAVKLTGRVFKSAISKYVQHQKTKARDASVKPIGKQTVKQLVGQNQGVTNIEIADRGVRDFDRVARKYGVDYAIKKDKSVTPPKYLVFFKARDADALTAAFSDYTAKTVKREERPSVLHQLHRAKEVIPNIAKERVKTKEPER